MLLWANAYAARNRVTELTVKQTNLTCTLEAWKIPIVSFLPSTDDFDMLREVIYPNIGGAHYMAQPTAKIIGGARA